MTSSIERAVSEFSAAEQALRKIIEQVESLREAESRLDLAGTTLESAGTAVDRSTASLQVLAEKLGLASGALEETSAQLRRAADTLLRIDPERMVESAEETQAEVHKLGTRLQQVVEARAAAMTDTVVSSVDRLRSDLGEDLKAVAATVGELGSDLRGETTAILATVEEQRRAAAGFDQRLATLAQRQGLLLVLVVAVLVLGIVSVVSAVG